MKVFQKFCPYCGYMLLFSTEILSRPGTAKNPGAHCPCCVSKLSQDGAITELDIDEVRPPLNVQLIREFIPPV